jgi:hypothetical protein
MRIILHIKLISNIFHVFIMFMHHTHLNNGGLGLSNNLVNWLWIEGDIVQPKCKKRKKTKNNV